MPHPGTEPLPGTGTAVLTVPLTSAAGVDAGDAERRGWELAHWAVAKASELGISEVAFAGKVWSAEEAGEGWRTDGPDGTGVRIRLAR
ncbi:hypothetical protein AB0J25_03915 [Streptomyces sp. NPDC049910]|uniref:hypothetical protein n=1 Tax=Streptomyces sp. NPDC049910 TaxID=3155278 RepID=UPI003433CDE3